MRVTVQTCAHRRVSVQTCERDDVTAPVSFTEAAGLLVLALIPASFLPPNQPHSCLIPATAAAFRSLLFHVLLLLLNQCCLTSGCFSITAVSIEGGHTGVRVTGAIQ